MSNGRKVIVALSQAEAEATLRAVSFLSGSIWCGSDSRARSRAAAKLKHQIEAVKGKADK